MKYAIISVSHLRAAAVADIQKKMKNHEFIDDIKYVDGRVHNAYDILNHMGISPDVYAPDDGRSWGMTQTEAGCWVSHMTAIMTVVDRSYEAMLVLEDDVVLHDDFSTHMSQCISELPEDFDFLSFYSEPTQNVLSLESNVGLLNIHKCISQLSYNQCMLYSLRGAKKIVKIARRMGATYNVDSIIYRASKSGFLNGYIVKPDREKVIWHGSYESIIDPENRRSV